MDIFKYLLDTKDPYIKPKTTKIAVRQLGIKQIVRVKTHANGDL